MDVVEVRVIQVAAVVGDAARRQRRHSHTLSLGDNRPERLVFDEALAQVYDRVLVRSADSPDADIRPAELAHPASMNPEQVARISSSE